LTISRLSECSALARCWGGEGTPRSGPAPGTQASAAPAPTPQEAWETAHLADLDNASLKKGLKLIWVSTGVDDGLMASTKGTVDMLKKHGFDPVFIQSPGALSWFNWRSYLIEFAPQLF
jgi:enterochelin esterase family protein